MNKFSILLVILIALITPKIECREYLSTADDLVIIGGSCGVSTLGVLANKIDLHKAVQWSGTLPGETTLQRLLGGEYYLNKSNFLDNSCGSAVTPTIGLLGMVLADLTWPQGKPFKDAGQDLLLYSSGLTATEGVTAIFKGLVTRKRPFVSLEPNTATQQADSNTSYNHQSFFSGHTSSAFFAVTYLNKRLRTIMRQRLSDNDYHDWQWLPPTILYSWATFVGWSRIHAYKHYISDILVGAVAGYLIGEFFYSLGNDKKSPVSDIHNTKMLIEFRFVF